jgi:hypothetical protein
MLRAFEDANALILVDEDTHEISSSKKIDAYLLL